MLQSYPKLYIYLGLFMLKWSIQANAIEYFCVHFHVSPWCDVTLFLYQFILQTGNGTLSCRPSKCREDLTCQCHRCECTQHAYRWSRCFSKSLVLLMFVFIQTGGYTEDSIPTVGYLTHSLVFVLPITILDINSFHFGEQVGFNMRKVTKGNVTIKLWDLGGQRRFRSMWERYCRGVTAIV